MRIMLLMIVLCFMVIFLLLPLYHAANGNFVGILIVIGEILLFFHGYEFVKKSQKQAKEEASI